MEDPSQSLLEDTTPRAVLRQQLDTLKPVDTPAPIRRAGVEKRKSRIENSLIRKKGGDTNLQTPILRQQSHHLSASALGNSLNATNIKGVDRTYADLSALDSDESSVNESIDLDLEAAARFRKRTRSMKYLTEPEVSLSKIAKKPKRTDKKTPQISKKSARSSNVSANRGHIEVNLPVDKTYANLSSSVMESSSDSIDLGAAKNIRHPKKQGIVFPQIDSVIPAPKSQKGDNFTDSIDLKAAKNIHHVGEQGIVFSEVDPVLSSLKSPHVDNSVDSSIKTYNLRGRSSSAPKWKSPPMFQSVQKDLAHKRKTSHSNQNTTLKEDPEPQFDETYESVVDNDDSLENVQLKTKKRFARKASSLNLNLSALIKDLRVKRHAFGVLEESQTENAAASERQIDENEISENQAREREIAVDTIKDLTAKSRSVGAVQESQIENVGASEKQPNEKETISESLATENEIVSDTQSSPATVAEESIADDRTNIIREDDNLPERPSGKVEGVLSTQMQSSSGPFAKTFDKDDVLSMEDESLDSSEYEINDPIPPPFNFRDVNEVDDDSLKSISASNSVANTQKTLSTDFSSDSGGDVELDGHISAALVSLDSEGENTVLSSSEGSNHEYSLQLQSHAQDEFRGVEKDANSSSLRERSLSFGKGTTLSPLRRSPRKSVEMNYSLTQSKNYSRRDIKGGRTSLPFTPRKSLGRQNTSLPVRMSSGRYAGMETTISSLRSPKKSVSETTSSPLRRRPRIGVVMETTFSPQRMSFGKKVEDKALSNPVKHIPEKKPGLTKLVLTQEEVEVHPEESIRAMQRASRNSHSNLDIVEMGPLLDTASHVKSSGIGHQQIINMQEKSTHSEVESEDMDDMSQKLTVEEDNITKSALAPVAEEIPANITEVQAYDIDLTAPHMEHTTDNEEIDIPQREDLRGKDGEHIFVEVEDLDLAHKKTLRERKDGSHIAQEDPLSDGEDATRAVQEDPVRENADGVHVEKDPLSDNEDVPITPEGPVSDDEAVRVQNDPVIEGKAMNIQQENSVNEGEDVAHLTQGNPESGENIAHVAQVDPMNEDEFNLLSVPEKKTLLLQEKAAEEGILTEAMAYHVTVEDKASDGDTSSEETPLIVYSQEKHSEGTDSSKMSATNTSDHKLASQPVSSKTKQLTMRDFLQKLASKPVQPPGLADKGRPRLWLGDLFGDKGTSLKQKPPQQAALAKRTRQTGKKPLPSCLPMGVTREIFCHFAKCKVAPNGMNEVIKTSEKYWKNLSLDLVNFMNARKGSSDILAKDVKTVLSRQGLITSDISLSALIEEYLPMEDWNVLIPTAFAKDNVYPSDPAD